jgi:hypothetical protein
LGDFEGSVDVAVDRVRGAGSYLVQKSQTPDTPGSWQQAAISTKSSCTVTGLTSGQHYWFRVAAIGAAGQGPWSDQADKQAP